MCLNLKQLRAFNNILAIGEMYRKGDPIWRIRHETGVSVGSIYRILQRARVPFRQPRTGVGA